jgi:hypothetical protein
MRNALAYCRQAEVDAATRDDQRSRQPRDPETLPAPEVGIRTESGQDRSSGYSDEKSGDNVMKLFFSVADVVAKKARAFFPR